MELSGEGGEGNMDPAEALNSSFIVCPGVFVFSSSAHAAGVKMQAVAEP